MSAAPKVFISYSQESEAHSNNVLAFASQLILDGIDVQLDRYVSPPQGWALWMSQQIKNSDFILMICTPTYHQRLMQEQPEGKAILGMLHNQQGKNINVIPVLLDDTRIDCIPNILATDTHYRINTHTSDGYDALYRHLRGKHVLEKPPLGELKPIEAQSIKPSVNIAHLPHANYTQLVGREHELALLDQAWESNNTRIFSLIAWGGVGKTALMHEWLIQMSADNYRGASHVFAYSFYSQGSSDDRQVSSDVFFKEVFHHLKVADADIPNSEYEKGAKLADVINQHNVLLLLDGLEPLQFAPSDTNSDKTIVGRLKDNTLAALLKNLAGQNSGLVVLSSRLPVQELQNRRFAKQHDLNNLSTEAGVALLNSIQLDGVTIIGPKKSFKEAVSELQGHALSLTLLGSYLCTMCEGDIRKRDTISDLLDDENHGAHTKRVLNAYIAWFTHQSQQQASWHIELNILCLISLFDRPVTQALIDVLLTAEPLAGITDHLQHLTPAKWKLALQRLQKLRLINNQNPDQLDCHPFIRDYFAQFVAQQFPSSYQQAHACLYEYYKALPEKELPDTLEEMQPLFTAVTHGCKAGLQQEVMDDVYWPRISRKEDFVVKKLGAFAADLACIAQFFEHTWHTPSRQLSEHWQSAVLNWAAFRLRGLSRLAEAVQPFETVLKQRLKEEHYQGAATNTSNLSELHLSLGNIQPAIDTGKQAVSFADKSGDSFRIMAYRTTYADALFHHAQMPAALTLFKDAEQLQQQDEPTCQYLYSLRGFRYCALLLAQGDWQDVIARAKEGLKIAQRNSWLLEISLNQVSLGNAYLQQAQQQTDKPALDTTKNCLNDAVKGLRKAGRNDFLPRGLLARANFYTFTQQHQNAWKDLNEAFEIAHFGGMRLFLTDYHLLAAENLLAQLTDTTCTNYFKVEQDEQITLTEDQLHTQLTQHLEEAEALIKATDYQLKTPALNHLRYKYAKHTQPAIDQLKLVTDTSPAQLLSLLYYLTLERHIHTPEWLTRFSADNTEQSIDSYLVTIARHDLLDTPNANKAYRLYKLLEAQYAHTPPNPLWLAWMQQRYQGDIAHFLGTETSDMTRH